MHMDKAQILNHTQWSPSTYLSKAAHRSEYSTYQCILALKERCNNVTILEAIQGAKWTSHTGLDHAQFRQKANFSIFITTAHLHQCARKSVKRGEALKLTKCVIRTMIPPKRLHSLQHCQLLVRLTIFLCKYWYHAPFTTVSAESAQQRAFSTCYNKQFL